MKEVVYSIVGGLLFAFVLFYLKHIRGVHLDSRKIEDIRKEIRSKPIGDVVKSLNDWLS